MSGSSEDGERAFDNKVRLLEIVQNYQMKEVALVWQRSALLVTLNGAGITLMFAQRTATLHQLIICALGLCISLVWFQIHRKGIWYAERFFLDAKNIIASDDRISSAFQCSIGAVQENYKERLGGEDPFIVNVMESRRREPRGLSATRTFFFVIWAFILAWIAVGVLALLRGL
jgi:hypothetical protein